MSLQMILGGSGSGKSRMLYEEIIKKSMDNPDINYIVVVPEQFTMSTQKELVRLHPNHSISNIDVVSFARLAYRIMEETGRINVEVLDEIGKSLILRKVATKEDDDLTILKGNMKRIGYISEMKSIISEFAQYEVDVKDIEALMEKGEMTGALLYKLEDIIKLYKGFREEIKDKCITPDEVLDVLSDAVPESNLLKSAVVAFDGFTGFTPIQYNVLKQLLYYTKMVLVTVTMDVELWNETRILEQELFRLSKTTIKALTDLANDVKCPVLDPVLIKCNKRLEENAEISFLEQNIFRFKPVKYENDVENIKIISCQNPEKELEFIAGEISRLVREENLRYKDISIITGDVAKYSRFAGKIMDRFNIPIFMDYKRDVMHNPFIECIRAALGAVKDNYSYLSMFRFIKSGMLNANFEDICLMENFCVAKGIKGHKKWNSTWEYHDEDNREIQDRKFTPDEMERINKVREQVLEALESLYTVFHSKTNAVEKSKALYEFLCKLEAEEKLKALAKDFSSKGELDLEKEYNQIYKTVIELLETFVRLMGEDEITTEEYMQILDAGFSEARIGVIPPGLDQVILGDITRTRLGDIKVLFFAGVNDGIIPSSDAGGGIISQSERAHLSKDLTLAPTLREKSYIQRFYLYLNLTKASDKLYLTYSGTDADGSSMRPSYLIGTLTDMFGNDIVETANEGSFDINSIVTPESALEFLTEHFEEAKQGNPTTLWKDLYRWYINDEKFSSKIEELKDAALFSYSPESENLGEELARQIYGEFLKNSVTRLEKYAGCAYAHFLEYGLKLQEREEFEFSSRELGSAIHDSLERFSKEMIAKEYSWTTLPQNLLDSMAEECVETTANELFSELLRSSSRNEYMISRMKRIMKRTVWAISRQMKAGTFEQKYAEHRFNYLAGEKGSSDDLKVWVKGKIDRMDIAKKDNELYVNVIDYKTGAKKFDMTEFYYGLSMQLAVYLDAAMKQMEKNHPKNEVKPAGVFYYEVKDPMVEGTLKSTDEEIDAGITKDVKLNGLYNADPEIMRLIDGGIGSSSSVIEGGIKKDGSLNETGLKNSVNEEEFQLIREHMNNHFSKCAKEILEGNAKINPYKLKKATGCDYCRFSSVCGFDKNVPGFEYNELDELSKDTIMERIGKKEGDNA